MVAGCENLTHDTSAHSRDASHEGPTYDAGHRAADFKEAKLGVTTCITHSIQAEAVDAAAGTTTNGKTQPTTKHCTAISQPATNPTHAPHLAAVSGAKKPAVDASTAVNILAAQEGSETTDIMTASAGSSLSCEQLASSLQGVTYSTPSRAQPHCAPATGQAKGRQGDDLLKEGDKCARTSLFKWTPDWEGAFMAYEKAALCFKAAKDQDKCKHAHLKAADAQYKCNLVHGAAKNYEAAGHCAREQKNWEEAVGYFRQASSLYSENGTFEKAAEVLTQAARGLEDSNADAAADLLLEAVDLLEQDSKRGAGDAFKRAAALLIRNQRIERAIGVAGKEIEFLQRNSEGGKGLHELYRSHLALVILHLHQNDYVAADKAYNQALSCEGFAPSNEGRAAAELLEAFENNAPDTLQACLSRQVFTFLDGPVLRLARGLRVNDSAVSGSSMAPRQQGETTDLRTQLLARPATPASQENAAAAAAAAAATGDDHGEGEDEEAEEEDESILL